jgi:hypothetical protein
MKIISTFPIVILLIFSIPRLVHAVQPTNSEELQVICTNSEVNTIYIPILRELADWPDSMLRPYAIQLCQLTKQKKSLQVSINIRAEATRTGNWRICKEVIPGNSTPTDSECKIAYDAKVNDEIDRCINLIGMGHNPHNVMLAIDPLKVEVTCLKGTDIIFQ